MQGDDGKILQEKGIFPYYFNDPANYTAKLDHLPSLHHFDISVPVDKFLDLCQWYETNYGNIKFALPVILDTYCTQDVKILVHGLCIYRNLVKDKTNGQDIIRQYIYLFILIIKIIFSRSITIASQTLNHFRQNYLPKLPPGAIPRVPPTGILKTVL